MVEYLEFPFKSFLRKSSIFAPLLLLAFVGGSMIALGAGFRASVVKIDVTPSDPQWLLGYGPRKSDGVHDHLFQKIIAMDDGKTQFFLVSTDICLYSPSFYDEVMHEIEEQTGVKPIQVWWTVTHTHAAPEVGPPGLGAVFMGSRYQHAGNPEYSQWVKQKLIEGIKEAKTKLAPARMGVGYGIAMANINRRAKDLEGPTFLGLNPDGPADRTIGLIRLEHEDGKILALIANYAMHGTVLGQENMKISADAPGLETIIVPIGGGGLIGGVGCAVKETSPGTRVVGVQTSRLPSMKVAVEEGKPVTLPASVTIADGIAVRRAGEHTLPLIQKYVDDIVTVEEEEIANAILLLLEREKTLAEGAGAVAVAALLNRDLGLAGKSVAVLVGGGNIDVTLLARIIERGLVKDGRLVRIRIHLSDYPGALHKLTGMLARHQANIVETSYDRAYHGVSLGDSVIEITMETWGPDHIAELISALSADGYVHERVI